MLRAKSFLVFPLFIFLCLSGWAQSSTKPRTRLTQEITDFALPMESATDSQLWTDPTVSYGPEIGSEKLLSPSIGQRFYEIAYELANSKNAGTATAEQATVFLSAAMHLGSEDSNIRSLLLKLASQHSRPDHAELVFYTLEDYVNESTDLGAARAAIRYLLGELNTRKEREILLKGLLKSIGGKNVVIRSDLECLLGLLSAEKTDYKSARYYLIKAYTDNEYNNLAFTKLTELIPNEIGPELYFGNLKLRLRANPLDIDSAIAFAQYAEQLQLYEIAVNVYEYSARAFRYLYPSEPLPARIYIPWVISYYNSKDNQHFGGKANLT
jgi:hypothetical protein